LKFTLFWGCAMLLILLVVSSSISVAEARNNHAKEENKQQQQLQQTNSCQGDRPLCIASNVAKMILCEHAICMIGP